MAIAYSGLTIINNTFVPTNRSDMATKIKDNLVLAGWTIISSNPTPPVDYKLESAITPQGLQGRVRIWDPNSGNCTRIALRNVLENLVLDAGPLYLYPESETWRIIANAYQAIPFADRVTNLPRKFVAFGIPYIESFREGAVTACMWQHGNSQSDSDATLRSSFRISPSLSGAMQGYIFNGTAWAGATTSAGQGRLAIPNWTTLIGAPPLRWDDDSWLISDPLLGWGLTGISDAAVRVRGQLWDCAWFHEPIPADDDTIVWDTRNWYAITNAATEGSLCHVIPAP